MLNPSLFANSTSFWGHLPSNIKIRLIDESGNFIDPHQIKEVDYLSRFINKCVVNKVFQKMMADKRSGVIEVYQDKVLVKEN
ncbi:hypothetical protein [Puia dinghuensis]|uniref:Uncharacterized protein n=1 Tax=Puia dinghuensis TaxID=1792502 RepID=A0A8J2XSY5_9BACT|nr:hypothetical protein [Puia dinghuensis]GGA98844.1 hypothetical protein GCM10011511_22710 [Puia dinghuensis]